MIECPCMRDVGRVQRRLREDAASAGAPGGEKSPARGSAAENRSRWRPISLNFSYFHLISVNFTSRPWSGAMRQRHSSSTRPKFLQIFLPRISRISLIEQSLSVVSAPSVVKCLCLRPRRTASFVFSRGHQKPCFANFAPSCGNSIQMPVHEQFTSKIKCLPIRANQA